MFWHEFLEVGLTSECFTTLDDSQALHITLVSSTSG